MSVEMPQRTREAENSKPEVLTVSALLSSTASRSTVSDMRILISFSGMQAFTFSAFLRTSQFDTTQPSRSQHLREDAGKGVQRHGPASREMLTDIRIRDANSNSDHA